MTDMFRFTLLLAAQSALTGVVNGAPFINNFGLEARHPNNTCLPLIEAPAENYTLHHLKDGHDDYPIPISLSNRTTFNQRSAIPDGAVVRPWSPQGLQTRGTCTQVGDTEEWSCDDIHLPGVDYANERVDEWGIAGKLQMNVFYTDMRERTARNWGNCDGRKFFKEFADEKVDDKTKADWTWVLWGRMCDQDQWYKEIVSISDDIRAAIKKASGKTPTDPEIYAATDPVGKHYSQAYAEKASGTVVILAASDLNPTNDLNGWDPKRAWGGWEFPALTRNKNIKEILRADPNTNDAPKSIWTPEKGPTQLEPKGQRGPSGVKITVAGT